MPWLDDDLAQRARAGVGDAEVAILEEVTASLDQHRFGGAGVGDLCAVTFCGDALGRDFVAAADDIVSSSDASGSETLTPLTGGSSGIAAGGAAKGSP
jgi:hypothetical protein